MGRWRTAILFAILASISIEGKAGGLEQPTQTFTHVGVALQAVRQAFNISTGFEATASDPDNAPITLDLSGTDIVRVFDSIVSQRPVYMWAVENGVYDIYPKNPRDRISEMSIMTYVVKDASPQEASDAITRLSEFDRWLSEHHVTRSEIISGRRWGVHPEQTKISLDLHGVSLRAILNQLIGKVGDNEWAIFRWGDKMQFVAVYF
jgi:hypothetical protein